jgi:hypothetical protein
MYIRETLGDTAIEGIENTRLRLILGIHETDACYSKFKVQTSTKTQFKN